jgi:hypothetical protein
MAHITLSSKAFAHKRDVAVTPSWLTNGHWAVRRDRLAPDARALPTTPGNSDEPLLRNLPGKVCAWRATARVCRVAGRPVRIFLADVGHRVAAFNRDYLALAGLDTFGAVLYGSDPLRAFRDAARTDSATFILMPMRGMET